MGSNLRPFGAENLAALPEELVRGLFMFTNYLDLLKCLHLDPDFPENNNVRLKVTKSRKLMGVELYRGEGRWETLCVTRGMNAIFQQAHDIFMSYYEKNKERILEEDMEPEDLEIGLLTLRKISNTIVASTKESNMERPLTFSQKDWKNMIKEIQALWDPPLLPQE